MAFLFPGVRGFLSSVLERFDLLEFNGSSSFGSHTDEVTQINSTGAAFCMGAWVYPHSIDGDQTIMVFGRSNSDNFRTLGITNNGGNPRFFHGSKIGGTYVKTYLSDDNISINTWYLASIYGSDNEAYITVDGKTATGTISDANYTNNRSHASDGEFYLGQMSDGSEFFDGLLAWPFLFDTNLSANFHVDAILKQGSNPFLNGGYRSNMVSMYSQKDGIVAGKVLDLTDNSYHLTETDVDRIEDTVAFPTASDYAGGFPTITNSWHTDGSGAGTNNKAFINLRDAFDFTSEIGSGDFSFLLRFKLDTLSGDYYILYIGDQSAGTTDYIGIIYDGSVIKLAFRKASGSTNNMTLVASPATDTWYTVQVSRSGTTVQAWADDGSDVGNTNSMNDTDGGEDEFHIGRFRTIYDARYMTGNIAQFVLWNDDVITGDNKSDLYNDGDVIDIRDDIGGNYVADESKIMCQIVPQSDVTINSKKYITNYSKGKVIAENTGEDTGNQYGSYEAEVPS